MRPSPRLLWVLAVWTLAGLGVCWWPEGQLLWAASGLGIALCAALDAWRLRSTPSPELSRVLPARFALNREETVRLEITNPLGTPLHLRVHDDLPDQAVAPSLPAELSIAPRRIAAVDYRLRFVRRGPASVPRCHLLLRSRLGLWDQRRILDCPGQTSVYPDYEPVVRYAVLSRGHQVSQMGVVKRRLSGVSREFHQLREYRDGDLMQQIDWKATSRFRQLISREYRDQRDQTIVFIIDDGRRMQSLDGDLSQFDHALNATLLLSYIATRQGDSVGCYTPATGRYLPPVRGPRAMATLLNHLYALEPTGAPCDYHEAAQRLMTEQKRHALVILITNLRSEDSGDLLPAIQLLKTRHSVLLASIRERAVEECLQKTPGAMDDALAWHAAIAYRSAREQTMLRLRSMGVHVADTPATDLPVELTNLYDWLKKSGLM